MAALGVGQLAYLGVGAQHVWDSWLTWNANATFVLPGISSAVGLWFVRMVTEPARFSRRLDGVVWVMIMALLVAVTLDTALKSRPRSRLDAADAAGPGADRHADRTGLDAGGTTRRSS